MATAKKVTKLSSVRLAKSPAATKSKQKVVKATKRMAAEGSHLIHESEKLAKKIYQDSGNILEEASHKLKQHSDELLHKVQKNPLTSLLLATGVGIVLSVFLGKK